MQIIDFKVADIKLDKTNPRQEKSKADVDLLADNMAQFGLLNAIELDENGTIITGETRFKAARQLGWKTIPAKIVKRDKTTILRQLSENIIRNGMNPYDIAQAVALYMKQNNVKTLKQVAKELGLEYTLACKYVAVSASTNTKLIELLKQEKIDMTAFVELSRAPEEIQEKLTQYVVSKHLTSRAISSVVAAYKKNKDQTIIDTVAKAKMSQEQIVEYYTNKDNSFARQLRKNLSPGQNIIIAASDLALALQGASVGDLAKMQLERVSLAIVSAETELKAFKTRAKI